MVKFETHDLNIWFGVTHAVKKVDIEIQPNEILSIIGPSNSGKTTFLRSLNRMNELNPNYKMAGVVEFERKDVKGIDVEELRRKVGMVFALPLPLPLSIFDNVAYGVKMYGTKDKKKLEIKLERALQQGNLWDEVKDRLEGAPFYV